jgi:DNA processing protein
MDNGKMRKVLVYFHNKYYGVWEDIYNAIENKEVVDPKKLEGCYKWFEERFEIITLIDDNYPNRCKTMARPPFVLMKKRNHKVCK